MPVTEAKVTVHLIAFGQLSPFFWKAMSVILADLPKHEVPLTKLGDLPPNLGVLQPAGPGLFGQRCRLSALFSPVLGRMSLTP